MVTLALGMPLVWSVTSARLPEGAEVLEARGDLRWLKGNLHTHTHWSDGDDYPEMVALWYRKRGYAFLLMTDHNTLQVGKKWVDLGKTKGGTVAYQKLKAEFPGEWVETRERNGRQEIRLKTLEEVATRVGVPGEFLLLQGEEISDRFEKLPLHLNVTNSAEAILPRGGGSVFETLQANVDAVNDARRKSGRPMLVHVNHPNFGFAVRAEDLMRLRGGNFFEVYNGHPSVHNEGTAEHVGTETMWDIILCRRLSDLRMPPMYGLAVDDGHNYHAIPSRASEPGRGWVVVLADHLEPDSLVAALEGGRFYASTGVTLRRIVRSKAGLEVEVEPENDLTYTIEFIGTRAGFDRRTTPVVDKKKNRPVHATERPSLDVGIVLKKESRPRGTYTFSGDELYVRARVSSSRSHPNPATPGEFERAWVQPVNGPMAASPE